MTPETDPLTAVIARWRDPEFWKDKGCRMDSTDCAAELETLAAALLADRARIEGELEELRNELAHARDLRNAAPSDGYMLTCLTVERDTLKAKLDTAHAVQAGLREALERAADEVKWWAAEHRCCLGHESDAMQVIRAALAASLAPKADQVDTKVTL